MPSLCEGFKSKQKAGFLKDLTRLKKYRNFSFHSKIGDFLIGVGFLESGKEHCGLIFAEMHRLSVGECIRRLAIYVELVSSKEMVNRIEFL